MIPYRHHLVPLWGSERQRVVSSVTLTWGKRGLTLYSFSSEPSVIVRHTRDGAPVFEDSAIELFFRADDGNYYYNFEMNAAGFLLIQKGDKRKGRITVDPTDIKGLERRTFTDSTGIWRGELIVPAYLFTSPPINRLRGNVYKCGDKTDHRHYLSLFPIRTPLPDFHRPDQFDILPVDMEDT